MLPVGAEHPAPRQVGGQGEGGEKLRRGTLRGTRHPFGSRISVVALRAWSQFLGRSSLVDTCWIRLSHCSGGRWTPWRTVLVISNHP